MSRKSPSLSATLFEVGQKCTGNDGNLWIVTQTTNGTHRWSIDVKGKHKTVTCKPPYGNSVSKTKTKSKYLIHDNGGKPFMVWKSGIYIKSKKYYELTWEEREKLLYSLSDIKKIYTQLIKQYSNVKKVLPGRDYSGYSEHGNTVLLELPNGKYVYVGDSIYEFTSQEPILKYYSWLGNNDVPYPVALSKNYAYFMLDKVYVARNDFPKGVDWADAYSAFYGHRYWPEPPKKKKSKAYDPRESDKNASNLKKIKMKGLKVIRARDTSL
jgi:hypothetical protein